MYTSDNRLGVSTQYVYLGGSLVAFREAVGTVSSRRRISTPMRWAARSP